MSLSFHKRTLSSHTAAALSPFVKEGTLVQVVLAIALVVVILLFAAVARTYRYNQPRTPAAPLN